MNKPRSVYLSGPMTGCSFEEANDWRVTATHIFGSYGIETLSPMRGESGGRQLAMHPRTMTARDRMDLKGSDLVLMNLLEATRVSIGSMIELGWADLLQIPVIVVATKGALHSHVMVNSIIAGLREDLSTAIEISLVLLNVEGNLRLEGGQVVPVLDDDKYYKEFDRSRI